MCAGVGSLVRRQAKIFDQSGQDSYALQLTPHTHAPTHSTRADLQHATPVLVLRCRLLRGQTRFEQPGCDVHLRPAAAGCQLRAVGGCVPGA